VARVACVLYVLYVLYDVSRVGKCRRVLLLMKVLNWSVVTSLLSSPISNMQSKLPETNFCSLNTTSKEDISNNRLAQGLYSDVYNKNITHVRL